MDIGKMTEEELLPLAAKAMGIAWPQKRANEHARTWNPARSNDDCMDGIFALGLVANPMGFETLPAFRLSILRRMAYLGLHK